MLVILSLVLSLILALLCVAIVWGTRLKLWQIASLFGFGLLLAILGSLFSAAWYPWTDLVVLLVAVSAGLLLGRVISLKLWPLLLVLVIFSILDIIQVWITVHLTTHASSTGTSLTASQLYGNFVLLLPWGQYGIGIFDLFLITAMAEYWRRRGASFLVALAPAIIGIVPAYLILLISGGILPLIPFLTTGWLCSILLYHWLKQANTPPETLAVR